MLLLSTINSQAKKEFNLVEINKNYDPDLLDTLKGQTITIHFKEQYPNLTSKLEQDDQLNLVLYFFIKQYIDFSRIENLKKPDGNIINSDNAYNQVVENIAMFFFDKENELSKK